MPTIGLDCEVTLDGSGYYVKPGTWEMEYPRIRLGRTRADANEFYSDFGPSKRVWKCVILAVNELVNYDGTNYSLTGEQVRDALITSYQKIDTLLTMVDAANNTYNVHFDSYSEYVIDLKTQNIAPSEAGALAASYEISISLVEG